MADVKGFRYIYDEDGNSKSVVLGLDEWGEIWEDLYDGMMATVARREPTISCEELKAEMDAEMEAAIEQERGMHG